jgi:uncharacterized membrane protein
MAGIGFVLRKLTSRGDLMGLSQAYVHASVSTSGGWLFTIVALSIIALFGPVFADYADLMTFRLIVVYNFAFSLVLTGPLTLVLTRYLSDQIFARNVRGIPGMVVGGIAIGLVLSAPLVLPFYFFYVDLTPAARLAACIGYGLVASIWVLGVFLSTLKVYAAVTRAFGAGMAVALGAAWLSGPDAGAGGMLAGFNVGLAYIVFALVARVLAEFPFPVERPFAFAGYFRTHWPLALSGGMYYTGIWVDKWLMWTAPERLRLPSGLISYPDYDSALFLACLSIVPSMAVFVVNIETRFFEQYHRFFRGIGAHATLARIREDQSDLLHAVLLGSRQLVLPQVVLALALVLLAPVLFTAFGIPYGQLGMFRIATLGALFQLFFLLLTIVLSYLDQNRLALALHGLFFAVNAVGTLATLQLGFPYYGYGYFLAAVVSFLVASVATVRRLDDLPYHAFITGNASIK